MQYQSAIRSGLKHDLNSYNVLKAAIREAGKINVPLLVNKTKEGKYRVLDGNTRLLVYKEFLESGEEGDWETIPAQVDEDMNPDRIEAIQLNCHMVPARDWRPYNKGKMLHDCQL